MTEAPRPAEASAPADYRTAVPASGSPCAQDSALPPDLAPDLREKLTALASALRQASRLCADGEARFALAYSGGLDSRFLAHAACLLGFRPLLLHVTGPHVPPEETSYAHTWAARRGLGFVDVPVDPLALPLVAAGDRRRCYACKRELLGRLLEALEERTLHFHSAPARTSGGAQVIPAHTLGSPHAFPETPPHAPILTQNGSHVAAPLEALHLCDGTNASDLTAYRPGTQAVRELGVLSPLAQSGLSKDDIRRIGAATGLEDPEQKARPCLLTRLPYGTQPLREILEALALAEQSVRYALSSLGLPGVDFRLRLPEPERAELHLLHTDAASLSPEAISALLRAAGEAAPGLPPPVLVPQDSLSGYYDRIQNTGQDQANPIS